MIREHVCLQKTLFLPYNKDKMKNRLKFSVITSVYKSDVPEYVKTAFESITEKELVMLLAIVESLYNKKGIYKNTSINTLQNMKPEEYPIFSELYEFLPEYKKDIKSKEKEKIIEQLDILLSRFLTGTDSYLFDGHTTINLDNDLIAFNLQELLYSGNQRLINTQTLNLLTYLKLKN